MQPVRITLPETQGAPVLSVNGALVIGLTGFLSCVLSAVKLPARCASVGTTVWLEPASARSHSRWYDPNQNILLRMTGPPALAPAWFCFWSGFRVWKKLRALSAELRWNSHAVPWNSLVPAFVTMLTWLPAVCPYSAEKLWVWIRISCTASGGGGLKPVVWLKCVKTDPSRVNRLWF